jgi:hypothetical protein
MEPILIPKPRQNKKRGRTIRHVDFTVLKKKLLTVLSRDIDHLMCISIKRVLTDKEAANLVKYTDFVDKLKKIDKEEVASLTDEELQKMANGTGG